MRYFHISYAAGAPTWNMLFGDYAVENAMFPQRGAIEYHIRKVTNAPASATVTIFQIQELSAADYTAFIA